jgi:hypothetical protein
MWYATLQMPPPKPFFIFFTLTPAIEIDLRWHAGNLAQCLMQHGSLLVLCISSPGRNLRARATLHTSPLLPGSSSHYQHSGVNISSPRHMSHPQQRISGQGTQQGDAVTAATSGPTHMGLGRQSYSACGSHSSTCKLSLKCNTNRWMVLHPAFPY